MRKLRLKLRLLCLVWRAAFCGLCCTEMLRFFTKPRVRCLRRVMVTVGGHRHVRASEMEER